jgi:hypothetical protein
MYVSLLLFLVSVLLQNAWELLGIGAGVSRQIFSGTGWYAFSSAASQWRPFLGSRGYG